MPNGIIGHRNAALNPPLRAPEGVERIERQGADAQTGTPGQRRALVAIALAKRRGVVRKARRGAG